MDDIQDARLFLQEVRRFAKRHLPNEGLHYTKNAEAHLLTFLDL